MYLFDPLNPLTFIPRYFPCLNKKYKESENNEVDKFYDLPGEISTKTDQCKRNFGIRATGCYVSDPDRDVGIIQRVEYMNSWAPSKAKRPTI